MDGEETITKRGRGRGRGARGGRARGRGRGRGRGRKSTRLNKSDDEDASLEQPEPEDAEILIEETTQEEVPLVVSAPVEVVAFEEKEIEVLPPTIDMEADISQLEAPTFTTITRGPPEPMLRLKWDHKVSLMGEKVLNPMIHCCDQCLKPILIYGRMIPCKHIFCLRCARTEPVKICPRCKEKVLRVEQSGLGTVFMCTHGGSRYGNTGCRRTYLSQRDLQAHINHRHVTPNIENKTLDQKQVIGSQRKSSQSSEIAQPSRSQPTTRNSSISTSAGGASGGRSNLPSLSDSQQALPGTPTSGGSMMHHQAPPPQTMPQDLSNYFSSAQSQYGQPTSYANAMSQATSAQSFMTMPMTNMAQSVAHSLATVTASTQYYSSYGQYSSIQTTSSQNLHYSNARQSYEPIATPYLSNSVLSSQILSQQQGQQQPQSGQSQTSQQHWQQQSYYR